VSRSQRAGDESGALTLSEDPLKLRSARLGGGIQLQLRHQFRLIKDDEEPSASRWHVSTGAYFYQLDDGLAEGTAARTTLPPGAISSFVLPRSLIDGTSRVRDRGEVLQ